MELKSILKISNEKPSEELLSLFNKIQTFKTERFARQLWDVGESILKKESAWNGKNPLAYDLFPELYILEHYKYKNCWMDSICLYHWDILRLKFENVNVTRMKGIYSISEKQNNFGEFLRDFFYGRIAGIITKKDSEDFEETKLN